MVQPFRDLLWRCSAYKLAKYAFDDRRLGRLKLSLTCRDGCAGNNAIIVPLNSPSRDPNVALGLYTTVLFIL